MTSAQPQAIAQKAACATDDSTHRVLNISGNAIVHFGDTYLSQRCCESYWVEQARQATKCHGRTQQQDARSVTTTIGQRTQYTLEPCLISLVRNATRSRSDYHCRTLGFLLLVFFGRFGLYLGYRTTTTRSWTLQVLQPRLKNIVPVDSGFMVACKQSDVVGIRHLLSTGEEV